MEFSYEEVEANIPKIFLFVGYLYPYTVPENEQKIQGIKDTLALYEANDKGYLGSEMAKVAGLEKIKRLLRTDDLSIENLTVLLSTLESEENSSN